MNHMDKRKVCRWVVIFPLQSFPKIRQVTIEYSQYVVMPPSLTSLSESNAAAVENVT